MSLIQLTKLGDMHIVWNDVICHIYKYLLSYAIVSDHGYTNLRISITHLIKLSTICNKLNNIHINI